MDLNDSWTILFASSFILGFGYFLITLLFDDLLGDSLDEFIDFDSLFGWDDTHGLGSVLALFLASFGVGGFIPRYLEYSPLISMASAVAVSVVVGWCGWKLVRWLNRQVGEDGTYFLEELVGETVDLSFNLSPSSFGTGAVHTPLGTRWFTVRESGGTNITKGDEVIVIGIEKNSILLVKKKR